MNQNLKGAGVQKAKISKYHENQMNERDRTGWSNLDHWATTYNIN